MIGMAMGWGEAERWGLRPRLAPPHMMGKNFPPHPCSLGPHEILSHLIKLYFLLIFPITSTIFFKETYFINKNILEITTKFIPSNQINF